jgi:hypothetical protein
VVNNNKMCNFYLTVQVLCNFYFFEAVCTAIDDILLIDPQIFDFFVLQPVMMPNKPFAICDRIIIR